jgi:hypothetical protein
MSDGLRHEPRCGVDFCDRCGDCLDCYGGENCYANGSDNGPHTFEDPDDDTKAITWTKAFRKGIKP